MAMVIDGPQQPVPYLSRHNCGRQISVALPDSNRERQITGGPAGCQEFFIMFKGHALYADPPRTPGRVVVRQCYRWHVRPDVQGPVPGSGLFFPLRVAPWHVRDCESGNSCMRRAHCRWKGRPSATKAGCFFFFPRTFFRASCLSLSCFYTGQLPDVLYARLFLYWPVSRCARSQGC